MERESCGGQAAEQTGRSLKGARLLAGPSRRTPGLWVPHRRTAPIFTPATPGEPPSWPPVVPQQGGLLAT